MVAIINIVILLKPYKRYKKIIIEKQLVDFLNTGEGNYIDEKSKMEYEYAIKREENKYNIDEFIKAYVDYVKKCVLIKKGEKISFNDYFVRANYWTLGVSKIDRLYCQTFSEYALEHIGQDEIESVDNGTFEKEFINELNTIFTHNSGNDYDEWYIEGNDEKIIELPYGFYIKYFPSDKENNRRLLKAIKLDIIDKTGMTPSLDKYSYLDCIDDAHGESSVEFRYKLKYESIDNKIETYKGLIYLKDNGGKLCYTLSCRDLLYTQSKLPRMEINNHDYDNWQRARNDHEEEVIRLERETDPSTVLVDQRGGDIEMLKKYNKFNNHDQYASINLNVYKDGSSRAFFRRCIDIRDENGKCIREEYMERELPYKNKTIYEVMELYINDKEQYSIDEELLKTGKQLVEYELTIWTPNNGFQKVETK